MKGQFLLSAIILLVALSCQDEQIVSIKSTSDIVIKTGTICGWCTKNDTLTIQENTVRYVNYAECNITTPTKEEIGLIPDTELDSLLNNLDFDEFKKIDLNTCNVCFDECDNWIYIEKDGKSHYIRFTGNESKLEPIKRFINQLNSIKLIYQ